MTTHALTSPDHPALHLLPAVPSRWQIEALGEQLMALEAQAGAVLDINTLHHHADHLYGRSATILAGTVVVGLPHKAGAITVSVGDITVWTEGHPVQRLTGAHILTSEPGARRAVFAHADTTWLCVQANLTGSTDLATIEAALAETPEKLITRRLPALEAS